MTCKQCVMWENCSSKDGTTRYYGKEVATNEVERLCSGFCPRHSSQECLVSKPIISSLEEYNPKKQNKSVAYYMRKMVYVGLVMSSIVLYITLGINMILTVYNAHLSKEWNIVCYAITATLLLITLLLLVPLQFLFHRVFWVGKKVKEARDEFLES